MKIKINTDIIKSLDPCKDRLENWLLHYKAFEGDLVEFLDLPDIFYTDKVWVAVRLMPRFLVEVFAIDCALNAVADSSAASADAAYTANYLTTYVTSAADASSAASSAAYAASADADADAAAYASVAAFADWRKQRQIESLIYLIQGAK